MFEEQIFLFIRSCQEFHETQLATLIFPANSTPPNRPGLQKKKNSEVLQKPHSKAVNKPSICTEVLPDDASGKQTDVYMQKKIPDPTREIYIYIYI